MVIVDRGRVGRLELDDRVGVLHGVATSSHRQHPQVVLVIAKSNDLIVSQMEALLKDS